MKTVKVLLNELKECRLPSLLTPLSMIGEVVCEMIIPVLMGYIVDRGIYRGDMSYIIRTGILMLVVALFGLLFGLLGGFFGAKASTGFAKNLRKAQFLSIQNFSFSNIDKFSPSSLVTRLTTDVTNIQMAYQMILRMAVRAPMSMIIAMIMSFLLNPQIAMIYLRAVIFLGVILVFLVASANSAFQKVFEKYDDLNESVEENVSAIRVVKGFAREDYEMSKFERAATNIYRMFIKAELRLTPNIALMQGTIYTVILLISWMGAHLVVGGSLTTGTLMSLLTYCMNILMSLMMLSMVFVMISMSLASARRIAEVLEEEPTIQNPENPVNEIPDGSIEFRNVSFNYDRSGGSEPVLKDINLRISSGESIGIIGATGSAKSSLVNLISRLYDASEGEVYVGGVDVKRYDLTRLRDEVAVVLQKNVLFTGSVAENLRWGNKSASQEDLERACQIACADEFINEKPDRYETHVEQGGSNFSGGQKQRLCIARALLKKPKIMILDDSTSAVDTATDAKIRKGLTTELPDMTKLIIAQRISSVQDCDRILVMDNGKIDGFDTHEKLLQNNRIYREIYESQTGISGDADFDEKG